MTAKRQLKYQKKSTVPKEDIPRKVEEKKDSDEDMEIKVLNVLEQNIKKGSFDSEINLNLVFSDTIVIFVQDKESKWSTTKKVLERIREVTE